MIREDLFQGKPDRDAYAIHPEGDCMEPEIFDGVTLICSPAAPLVAGKYVVLWFRDGREPLLKRLVELPSALPDEFGLVPLAPPRVHVEQLNPRRSYWVPIAMLRAIDLVVAILSPEERAEALRLAGTTQLALPAPNIPRNGGKPSRAKRSTDRQVTA
jgi:hypothetical protein